MGTSDKYVEQREPTQSLVDPNYRRKIFLRFCKTATYLGGHVTLIWSIFSSFLFVYSAIRTKCYDYSVDKCGVTFLALFLNIPLSWFSIRVIRATKLSGDSQQDEFWKDLVGPSRMCLYWGVYVMGYLMPPMHALFYCQLLFPWDAYAYIAVGSFCGAVGLLYYFQLQKLVPLTS